MERITEGFLFQYLRAAVIDQNNMELAIGTRAMVMGCVGGDRLSCSAAGKQP